MDKLRERAEDICATLARAGHRALFAGGCVRDLLLDKPPKDYDIATSARPEEVEQIFEHTVGVGAAFGVQMVVFPEGQFEVATFRSDSPYIDGRRPEKVEFLDEKTDALRRDFTINALFMDTESGEVIDYVDGRNDLGGRLIRAVGDPRARFEEDHLRMLRAVRLAAQLDFALDDDTAHAIRECVTLINKISPERIRNEILRLLTEPHAPRGLHLMDETGLLREVLPEIAAMKGVEQPPQYHPEGDVFTHTLLLFEHLEKPSATLALAALLHDVGKPVTQTFEDRIRFNHHDVIGADMTEQICKRLHLSNDEIERSTWLVSQHMRVAHAQEMRESKLKRLVREDGFPELLELFRADCLASHGDLGIHDWLKDYAANLPPEQIRPEPLVTGQDLIDMGYTPGPLFAKILRTLEDLQLERRLDTPEDARAYITDHWHPNQTQ